MLILICLVYGFGYGLWCLLNLRYGLRYYICYLWTLKQNVGFIWVTDKCEANKYLQSVDKGNFIEAKLSRNAWKPILSLESENGEAWILLKDRLMLLMKLLPDVSALTEITNITIDRSGDHITSNEVGVLTIQVFMQYVFGVFETERLDYHNKCCYELYEASLEFRKEIALKGWGDVNKKKRAVTIISEYLVRSKYNLPNDIYSVSVVLQPFIISPAINVSDVAISWDLTKSIEFNITINHPFPILEREIVIDGNKYQVFIPTDELKILPFGYGPRQCSGKAIASTFLKLFFMALMQKKIYKPRENHMFSGRDNDVSCNIEEILFQLNTIVRLFIFE